MDCRDYPHVLLCSVLALASGLSSFVVSAGQIDSATFFMMRRGMSESEILVRAGAPDLVTLPGGRSVELERSSVVEGDDGSLRFTGFRRADDSVIERWHYVPADHEPDPFITVVSIRGGKVWEIERTKVFTRHRLDPNLEAAASARDSRSAKSDHEVMAQRLERTFEAAKQYAKTRARLKQAIASQPAATTTVYRQVQEDGSVYFGDRPPGETAYIDVTE